VQIPSEKEFSAKAKIQGTVTIRLHKPQAGTKNESMDGLYTYSIKVNLKYEEKTASGTTSGTFTMPTSGSVNLGESTVRLKVQNEGRSIQVDASRPKIYRLTTDGTTVNLRRSQRLNNDQAESDWLELKVVPPQVREEKEE
jgi:hypothetical protein